MFLLLIIFDESYSQPAINWSKSYGGSKSDVALSSIKTSDNNYIICGYSNSVDGNFLGNKDSLQYDAFILKIDSSGNSLWHKTLGGSKFDLIKSVKETKDGGYIACGYTNSTDGDIKGNHGLIDIWIIKFSKNGAIEWSQCYGGSKSDIGNSICQTEDGGYVIGGSSNSNDGEISNNHNSTDIVVLKISQKGILEWQKCIGGSSLDVANFIELTNDLGFIICGYTTSIDGDISYKINGNTNSDILLVKLSTDGTIEWLKCYGGSLEDMGISVKQIKSGEYFLAASVQSSDFDVQGNHGGNSDIWIAKIGSSGKLLWSECFGGNQDDWVNSINFTNNEELIIAGKTNSTNGDITDFKGGESDFWLFQISQSGNLEWQKSLGGTNEDEAIDIFQTKDNGYLVTGFTNSSDGNIYESFGQEDIWVVKLFSDVDIQEFRKDKFILSKIITSDHEIRLKSIFSENLNFEMYDLIGNKIDKNKYKLISSAESILLNFESLHSGIYYFIINQKIFLICQNDFNI